MGTGIIKLAVIGTRTFTDRAYLFNRLDNIRIKYPSLKFIIVSGEHISSRKKIGADIFARDYAKERGLQYIGFPADWLAYGKAAGPMRNSQIAECADECYAFWNGESTGTLDCMNKFKELNKPVHWSRIC